MVNIAKKLGNLGLALVVVLLVMACGPMEGDVPAEVVVQKSSATEGESSAEEGDREVEEEENTEEDEESEEEENEIEEEEGDVETHETGGEIPEEVESGRCAQICFKLAWCGEEGPDFSACVAHCEADEFNGVASERVLRCLEEGSTCREVEICQFEIEACDEVCGVYTTCELAQEGAACHEWCADEIWEGRLDWSSQGCVEAAGRHLSCGEVDSCGLSAPVN